MKVLFYAVNGIGIGHLCRLLGVAEETRLCNPNVKILFFTEVDDVRLIKTHNFGHFHVPPEHRILEDQEFSAFESDNLIDIRGNIIQTVVQGFAPAVVVHDALPDKVLMRACANSTKHIIILRRRTDVTAYIDKYRHELNQMCYIAFPYDKYAAINIKPFKDFQHKIIFTGPLLRRTVHMLDTNYIRKKYNLREGLCTLVLSNGGGSALGKYSDNFWNAVLEAVRILDSAGISLQIIAVTGPLSKRPITHMVLEQGTFCMVEFEARMMDLFATANVVVARGGYNTVLEVAEVGVPTICIPAQRKSDNQYERIMLAAKTFSNVYPGTLITSEISVKLLQLCSDKSWSFLMPEEDLIQKNKKRFAQKILML